MEGIETKKVSQIFCSILIYPLYINDHNLIKGGDDHKKQIDLEHVPHITLKQNNSPHFGKSPCVIAVSNEYEFLAVDTQERDVPFILVYRLEQFLTHVRSYL